MTVRELIEKLSVLDGDLPVTAYCKQEDRVWGLNFKVVACTHMLKDNRPVEAVVVLEKVEMQR